MSFSRLLAPTGTHSWCQAAAVLVVLVGPGVRREVHTIIPARTGCFGGLLPTEQMYRRCRERSKCQDRGRREGIRGGGLVGLWGLWARGQGGARLTSACREVGAGCPSQR